MAESMKPSPPTSSMNASIWSAMPAGVPTNWGRLTLCPCRAATSATVIGVPSGLWKRVRIR